MTRPDLPILLGLAVLTASCASVQRFLVPPKHAPETTQAQRAEEGRMADLVVHVGSIQGHAPTDRVIAVRGGRIAYVGTREGVQPLTASATVVLRQATGLVLPGFVDAHVHLDGAAMLADAMDLRPIKQRSALRPLLERWKPRMVVGDWLWGFGLARDLQAEASMADLDAVLGDVPAYLSTADGHGALVGSALVKLLPEALGKEVVKKDGRLDEVLAQQVWRALPPPRRERLKPLVHGVLADLQRRGLTEVHSMGASRSLHEALLALDHEGRLPIKVRLFVDGDRPEGQLLLSGDPQNEWPDRKIATARVKIQGVKYWLDGALGARTAALAEPYADEAVTTGLLHPDAQVEAWITAADKAGLQTALHAIGDAAVEQVVRVVEKLKRKEGLPPVRIEHAQIVSPATLQRMKGLAIVCSIQPLHAQDDAPFAAARLGRERLAWAYRGLQLADVCPVLAGSDLPVSEANPVAMARALAESGKGLEAERLAQLHDPPTEAERQAMDELMERPLRALLPGGTARPSARLEVGMPADFVVWSRDPLEPGAKPAEPLLVVVDGIPTVLSMADRDLR